MKTSAALTMWGLIDVYKAVCLSVPDVEKLSPRGGSSAMTEISDVSAERKNSNKFIKQIKSNVCLRVRRSKRNVTWEPRS